MSIAATKLPDCGRTWIRPSWAEQQQGLAQRGPADAELLGQFGLGQPRPGRQGAAHDHSAQRLIGLVRKFDASL